MEGEYMKPLALSSFADYQELSRYFDRMKYKRLNEDLQQARKRAEYWYKNGDSEMGASILSCASGMFELEKFCMNKEEII